MLRHGRLKANAAEHKAIDDLVAGSRNGPVSVTRRDPREKGPLLAHVGDKTYVISKTGKVEEA